VLLVGLHGSIAAMVNLGIFSAAMIAYDPFLLTTAQWKLFGRLVPRKRRARVVFYDADCGVCFFIARVLARLDVFRRLRMVSNQDRTALPAGIDSELLDRTLLVVDRRRRAGAGRAPRRSTSVRGAAARAPLGVAAAPARPQSAGGRRVRRLRTQPDAHLDLARAGPMWSAGRPGRGRIDTGGAGSEAGAAAHVVARAVCRWCASWASGWCS
jgi:hypothetical protein